MKKQKVILTTKEKSELFGEGVITVILLLLLNLSIIILLNLAVLNDPRLENGIFSKRQLLLLTGCIYGLGNDFLLVLC